MIIDHNHAEYRRRWRAARSNKHNGAFYKVSVWKVVDNADAAVMLQRMLDEIDGRKR